MPYPILYIKTCKLWQNNTIAIYIWGKVCKNGPSEICGRPYPFKFFKGSPANFTWSILEYFVPFSQLLPIYQICVAKRNFSLRKVVFFYSVRLKFFLNIKGHSYQATVFILFVFWLSYFARLHKKSSVFHECQLWCFARFGTICTI